MADPYTDDNQFDPFSGILTPQALAMYRQQQAQQQMAQAGQLNGRDYLARMAGMGIGQSLNQMAGPPNTPMDQMAAQNQQMLSAPTDVQPTGDAYQDRAAQMEALSQRFQNQGNMDVANRLWSAAQIARSQGLRAQREQAQTAVEQGKLATMKAGAQYSIVDSAPDSNGIPQYKTFGQPISLYNDDGTVNNNFQQQYKAALQAAQDAGATSPRLLSADQLEQSKAQTAAIRSQATIQAAMIRAMSPNKNNQSLLADDEGALNQLTGAYALNGAPALARFGAADRAAVIKNLNDKGLTYQDAAEAQIQFSALRRAIDTGATRTGQVMFLTNEIPGQAANVTEALKGVDRTRLQAVNKLIAAGKTDFGDPAEARYAVALNGLIVPYARLIAGATGVTSDAAREEAMSLLNKYQSPEQVQAVLDQIVNRELQTAKDAGEGVIEMARNSQRYSALRKVSEKLGIPVTSLSSDGSLSGSVSSPSGSAGAGGAGQGPGLPDASANKGRSITNRTTGQRLVSDGTNWVPTGSSGGASGSF
jgi:hypothetical protein